MLQHHKNKIYSYILTIIGLWCLLYGIMLSITWLEHGVTMSWAAANDYLWDYYWRWVVAGAFTSTGFMLTMGRAINNM